jgi:hypothetical protein
MKKIIRQPIASKKKKRRTSHPLTYITQDNEDYEMLVCCLIKY